MNIGVTGGAGFIGSHIVDKLVQSGHNVTIFDLTDSKRTDASFIKLNILDRIDCNEKFKNFDVVFHLAAVSDVNYAIRNKSLTLDLNIKGTSNVLEACEYNKVKRMIFASTEWVYSGLENPNVVADEEQNLNPKKMDHVYSSTKFIGENIIQEYCKYIDLNYTILRFGIPYGERGRPGTVFYNFINNILESKDINIYGSGKQYRNFIYVKDLAEGCMAALSEKAENEIFNLSGSSQISIKDIAEKLKKVSEKSFHIQYIESRNEDFKGVTVSIKKAKELLNWVPRTEIDDGLLKYYKHLEDAKRSLPQIT